MAKFKLALTQRLVEGGAVERNLDQALNLVSDAAGRGCQLVLLPECLDLGWTHPAASLPVEPIPGPSTKRLSKAAESTGIFGGPESGERKSCAQKGSVPFSSA